jgi:hypothetical protein
VTQTSSVTSLYFVVYEPYSDSCGVVLVEVGSVLESNIINLHCFK